MKLLVSLLLLSVTALINAQNIQLHQEFRHSLDHEIYNKNFLTMSFEYLKNIDTNGTGSFLLKTEMRFDGERNNMCQVFTQLTQTLKFWKPDIYVAFTYSGGLGVTPDSFGYNIVNSFGIGPSGVLSVAGGWLSVSAFFRVNTFSKLSYDPQLTIWFGRNLIIDKFSFSGTFVFWSQNLNHGTDLTGKLHGKKIAFFWDPQLWMNISKNFSVGSKMNVYYHIDDEKNRIKLYPTLGIKYKFE
jgi:hypothetical protein